MSTTTVTTATTTAASPPPSAPASGVVHSLQDRRLITHTGWLWIGLLTLLFSLLHFEFLRRTWIIARSDNNWSHALLVPLISLFFIYQRRDRLAATPRRLCWWGLPILFAGMFWYTFWIYGRVDMFRGYGMIVSLFGLVLFLLGPAMMRVLWFPILYLVFAVKVSDLLWDRIAQALQDVAAQGATYLMKMASVILDFDVNAEGNTINIWHDWGDGRGWRAEGLNVHEVCSGLRMLMAFLALGTALAFLWERAWWQRIVMIALAVPIAVAVNILRVATLGLLTLHDPALAHGDFHMFVGMLMLIPAAGMFLLVGWVLDRLIIVEGAEEARGGRGVSSLAAPRATTEAATVERGAGNVLPEGKLSLPRRLATLGGCAVVVLSAAYLVWAAFVPSMMSAGIVSSHAAVASRLILALIASGVLLWLGWTHRSVWRGAFVGGVLSLLLAMLLLFTLAVFRPEVILKGMSPAMAWTLLMGTTGLVVAAAAAVPWLVRGDVMRGLVPRYGMALGLAAAVLLVGWIGQNRLIAATGWVLAKEPLPLRHPLPEVARRTGVWQLETIEPLLSEAIVQALGTEKYTSVRFEDLTWKDGTPGRVLRLHLAYYSGTVDTVAHVPDRCIIAGGASSAGAGPITLQLDPQGYTPDPTPNSQDYLATAYGGESVRVPGLTISASLFSYTPPDANNQQQNVFYFFVANGSYRDSPASLRLAGFDPRDTYSYYCKVEVHVPGVSDPTLAKARAEAFLSQMLPEILRCLPDWTEVEEGTYPPKDATGNAAPPIRTAARSPFAP